MFRREAVSTEFPFKSGFFNMSDLLKLLIYYDILARPVTLKRRQTAIYFTRRFVSLNTTLGDYLPNKLTDESAVTSQSTPARQIPTRRARSCLVRERQA